MKRILKSILCLLMCVITVMPVFSPYALAAVKTVSAVKNLGCDSKTYNSITLSWKKVQNADGYQVYIISPKTGKWVKETSVSKNTYTDKRLSPGKAYTYKVRAFSKSGKRTLFGNYSTQLRVLTKPKTVTGIKVGSVTGSSISLSWKKAAGADSYDVYQRADGVKSFIKVASVNKASYKATGLVSMTGYKFYVKSVAKDSKLTASSSKSKTVGAKTGLGTVGSINISGSDKQITVTWPAVRGADSYRVYFFDESSKKWIGLSKQNERTADFYPDGKTANIKIRFRAYGGGQTSALSKAFVLNPLPAAPTGLQAATSADNGIALRWNAVSGAAGYVVERYDAANGAWKKVGISGKTSFVDRGISESSVYTYRVCSYTVNGKTVFYGEYSSPVYHEYRSTEEPKSIYSKDLENSGVIGYLYDPKRNVFYTAADPWQRNFGFNIIYDTVAPFTLLNYATVRFKFRADGKDWMIQAWKGQYGLVFYGGEVGVYTKPTDRDVEHYDCASNQDMLKMSMVFFRKSGLTKRWVKSFERPYGTYWWCTGFKPGNNGYNFSVYKMNVRITMKTFEMLEGMKKAMDEQKIPYIVSGLDVFFEY